MSDGYEPWKVNQAEFQGFVKSELNNLKEFTSNLHKSNVKRDDRIRKVENDVLTQKIKSGFYGTIGGAVVIIASTIIGKL